MPREEVVRRRVINPPITTTAAAPTAGSGTAVTPDSVIAAPRDLQVKVTLRGPGSNEAFIKIAAP